MLDAYKAHIGLVFEHMHAYVNILCKDAWGMRLPKEENVPHIGICESFTPFKLCKAVINRCGAAGRPPVWHDTPQTHAISLSCLARDVLPVRESTCRRLAGTRKMSPSIKMLSITCPLNVWYGNRHKHTQLTSTLPPFSARAKIKVALFSVAPANMDRFGVLSDPSIYSSCLKRKGPASCFLMIRQRLPGNLTADGISISKRRRLSRMTSFFTRAPLRTWRLGDLRLVFWRCLRQPEASVSHGCFLAITGEVLCISRLLTHWGVTLRFSQKPFGIQWGQVVALSDLSEVYHTSLTCLMNYMGQSFTRERPPLRCGVYWVEFSII